MHTSNLNKTRENIILFSFYASVFICSVFLLLRLIEQKYDMALVSFISLVLSLSFIYLAKKGYVQQILIFSNIVYLTIAFAEGIVREIPPQTIIYFSVIPVIIAFLLNSNIVRIGLFVLNTIAFITLHILVKTFNLSDILTYVIITTFTYVIVIFFIKMLEDQEQQLLTALSDRQKAIEALEVKHQETLLFNDMMNHDIKAPLRTIKGFTSILRKKTKPTTEQIEYIDFIANSAKNLESLIANILTMTKINTVKMNTDNIDINRLIEQICLSLSYDIKRKKIDFKIDSLPSIQGNKEILRTVFQNIISNSIKYQPKSETHIPNISITHKEDEAFDLIYIQDNGIGIKEENITQLFKPFVRFHSAKDYEGTGLGMTICKKIMEKHNGDIRYISNKNQGTCFELRFPRVLDAQRN